MQLWTDYEGVTIDGAFPLKKLLLPEGRSAFFSTAGSNGEPTVVRLVECHFDEEQILARWDCMKAFNHPNFLKFEHYGQIELDGGPVVYAVFENVDANLADVLSQGHLTVKDVVQLACSLVAALDTLHTHGFVHEHIEPRNIFAVGDVVRLRSDCIREAPEAEKGRAARQRDVCDLAIVLLQSLTQQQSIDGIPDYVIPPPFDKIIRNGLDGTWGLDDIRIVLESQTGASLRTPPKSSDAAPPSPAAVEQQMSSVTEKVPVISAQAATPVEPGVIEESWDHQLPLPLVDRDQKAQDRREETYAPKFIGATTHNGTWGEKERFSPRQRWFGAVAIVTLLLLLPLSLIVYIWHARQHGVAQAAVSQPAASSARPLSSNSAPARVAASAPNTSPTPAAASHAGWRVISFTYSRKTDAEKKVSSLARSNPALQPAVFTPSGHAPYLVSIGGVMDRNAAQALAGRSRSLGLPHDTYAQNYSH